MFEISLFLFLFVIIFGDEITDLFKSIADYFRNKNMISHSYISTDEHKKTQMNHALFRVYIRAKQLLADVNPDKEPWKCPFMEALDIAVKEYDDAAV